MRESLIYLMQYQTFAALQVLRYLDSATLYALYTSNEMIAEFIQTNLLKADFLRLIATEKFTQGVDFLRRLEIEKFTQGTMFRNHRWDLQILRFAEAAGVLEKNINWLKVWKAIRAWDESWLKLVSFLLQPVSSEANIHLYVPMYSVKSNDTLPYTIASIAEDHRYNDIDTLHIKIVNGTLENVMVEMSKSDWYRSLQHLAHLDGSVHLWMTAPILFIGSARYSVAGKFAEEIREARFPWIPPEEWDASVDPVASELGKLFSPPIELFNDIFALRQNILDAFEIEK